jgi:hypothetical protein
VGILLRRGYPFTVLDGFVFVKKLKKIEQKLRRKKNEKKVKNIQKH